MAKWRQLSALAFAALTLSACATTPDPAKICTAEWIEPRAERAVERIEKRTAKSIRALRKAGADYVAGKTPGPLTLFSLRSAVRDLEDELKNGPGTRDLRLLARTCDDPEFIREKMTDWLDKQQIPTQIMAFLDATNLLDRLVELAEGDPLTDGGG